MYGWMTGNRLIWLALGLVGGIAAACLWPQTPLHAVATDRIETFAMATGPVDEEVEAVYFLDFLTGDLRAVVLGKQNNKFQAFFAGNVMQPMGLEPAKKPKFLMVTGLADMRRGGTGLSVQPGRALVYVAEVTSGKVAAFAIPWSPSMRAPGQIITQKLVPIDMTRFRAGVVPDTDE